MTEHCSDSRWIGLRGEAINCGLHGEAVVEPSIVLYDCLRQKVLYTLNPDVPYAAGCMIKVPLAIVLFHMIEMGRLDPEMQLLVSPENVTDTVPPAPFKAGSTNALMNFVFFMLQYSDNVAYNVLLDLVDRAEANETLRGYGLNTWIGSKLSGGPDRVPDPKALGRNRHTAQDTVDSFRLLEEGRVPGAKTMKEFLHVPKGGEHLFGFQNGDDVIMKTGFSLNVCHIGGIVELLGRERLVFALHSNMSYADESAAKSARARLLSSVRARFLGAPNDVAGSSARTASLA